jgi:hypothetical protein
LDLLVIANCLAAALPAAEPVRKRLVDAYAIPRGLKPFIVRANDKGRDTYGVHIVTPSALQTLRALGVRPTMCDLGHDALIQARDNASMYLRVIGCFSGPVWAVYVTGLSTVPDQLLKWIAEFTKAHPWRFVFLEGCDTSWNFSENRDRCVLSAAPRGVTDLIATVADLSRPAVRALRPCHEYELDGDERIARMRRARTWSDPDSATAGAESLALSYFADTGAPGLDASALRAPKVDPASTRQRRGLQERDGDSSWGAWMAEDDDEVAASPVLGTSAPSAGAAGAAAGRGRRRRGARHRDRDSSVGDIVGNDDDEEGDWDGDGDRDWDGDEDAAPAAVSSPWGTLTVSKSNYRKGIQYLMQRGDPCVVLLVSPPGAGKSHFSKDLAAILANSDPPLTRAFIDGSDDELVDTALSALLDREVPPGSTQNRYLIVDEFHMLSAQHKRDLFAWLAAGHARRLSVLMIANRIDSSDQKLLDSLRDGTAGIASGNVRCTVTRLDRELLNEVMESEHAIHRESIALWFHAARCVFGGEAISLRAVHSLDDALERAWGSSTTATSGWELAASLRKMLSSKLPRISQATSDDFVGAFVAAATKLRSEDATTEDAVMVVKRAVRGPVSLMFQSALLTLKTDRGVDFPDFVERSLGGASDCEPAAKIVAWCAMMRSAADNGNTGALAAMSAPGEIFEAVFVDQVGFPLQLRDATAAGERRRGLTFSWGGSYESLEDMTDAVRRGHSIDWNDVYERHWNRNEVTELSGLVVLLSACRSPRKVLEALQPRNLTALMQRALSDDALRLAQFVVEHRVGADSAPFVSVDDPFPAAVWTVLACTPSAIPGPRAAAQLLGGDPVLLHYSMEWAALHAADLRDTRAPDPAARTAVLAMLLQRLALRALDLGDTGADDTLTASMAGPRSEIGDAEVGTRRDNIRSGGGSRGHNGSSTIPVPGASRVPNLFRGTLAPLLCPSACPAVAAAVAVHETDAQKGWPHEANVLWRLARGEIPPGEVWEHWKGGLAPLLLVSASGANSPRRVMDAYATGLLVRRAPQSGSQMTLPPDLQEVLLIGGAVVDLDASEATTDAEAVDWACKRLFDGIVDLAQEREARVALGPEMLRIALQAKVEDERRRTTEADIGTGGGPSASASPQASRGTPQQQLNV